MFTSTKDLDEKYTNSNNQVKTDKSKSVNGVVCSFWLKNACKYGSSCKYLHEDIPEKYPECEHGINCTKINSGCPFKHTKKSQKECHNYNAGYCAHGKQCKDLHNEQNICLNYLLGFCPEGPNCKLFHLKTLINPGHDNLDYLAKSLPNLEPKKTS